MCKGLQDSMSSFGFRTISRFDTGIWVAMEFLAKGFNCITFTEVLFSVDQVVPSPCCPTSEQHSRRWQSKTPSPPSAANAAHKLREQRVQRNSPESLSSTLLQCPASGSQLCEHRACCHGSGPCTLDRNVGFSCRLRRFSILSP